MNSSVRRVAVVFSMLSSLAFSASTSLVAQTAKRAVRVGDMYRLRNVGAPEISPDGQWVAYTVTSLDSAKDKSNTDVWMASWDGTQVIQLTSSPDAETSPRWSPDGKYLSFLSSREGGKGSQLWLLDRRGGEAQRVTRAERRHRRVRVGAGQQAYRAHHARVARHGRFRRVQAEADRHRPIPLQGRRQRLPRLDARSPLPVRRRRQESDADHAGHVRRIASGLVARWKIARLRQHASAGSRPRPDEQLRRLRRRSAGRRRRRGVSPRSKDPTTGPSRGVRTAVRSRICKAASPNSTRTVKSDSPS